ncbi:MAG: L-seryl-tRNA(Sec) selenium transferase, partial [Desulfobacterales bacterium]
MKLTADQQKMVRRLPGVDHILELTKKESIFEDIPQAVLVNSIRKILETLRKRILSVDLEIQAESLEDPRIMEMVEAEVCHAMTPNLKNLVNATGVVVHTNLGRSLLA